MNCRPGDLAVMVRSDAGNEGAVVEVVSFVGPYQFECGKCVNDAWLCKVPPSMERHRGRSSLPGHLHISDSKLRPLRDSDGQDESLSWKEVPKVDFLEWRAA
jgi:hypothetical protein